MTAPENESRRRGVVFPDNSWSMPLFIETVMAWRPGWDLTPQQLLDWVCGVGAVRRDAA